MAIQINGLIIPRGMALSLRLYHINGRALSNTTNIINKLKEYPVELKERRFYEGFSDIELNGNIITVAYTIGQPIRIQRLKDGELTTETLFSQGNCIYVIHPKEKYLECRGTTWVVKKGLPQLMEALNVEFDRISLDQESMNILCKEAIDVSSVLITDIRNHELTKIQLNGAVLKTSQWSIFRKQGTIRAFKGLIELTTGGTISTRITNEGSMLIYKKGDGIPVDDVDATVNTIMKLVNNS
ncbi:MAG: hypothetical protein FK731_11845 [Asgard group archaeon]|nr:hypothetical protein [Asgard group archaeon]